MVIKLGRNINYKELARARIQDKRNIVISKTDKELSQFTIAQQLIVEEGNRNTYVFMKNAFHVDNIEGLYNLRDALNVAIAEAEKETEQWDDVK